MPASYQLLGGVVILFILYDFESEFRRPFSFDTIGRY